MMVWGAIFLDGRSDLIFMERDPTAARRGYTTNSYLDTLEEGLLPIYDGTRHFQQDNAPIHTAEAAIEWLQIHQIEYIDWPPHSPDLNPIEHVWKALKAALMKSCPHLRDLSNNSIGREELKRCLRMAWRELP
jgi:hypothetical protein